jgi:hypothetical protein
LQPDADSRTAGKTLRSFARRPEAATRRLAHAPHVSLATSEGMDVLISLQYANGRIHEATYTTSDELSPNAEFNLHGRRWRRRAHQKTPRKWRQATHVVRFHRSQLVPATAVGSEALGVLIRVEVACARLDAD